MSRRELEELNLCCPFTLVVVACLEVALRVIKVVRRESFEPLSVYIYGKLTAFVADFIGETLATGYVVDIRPLLGASAALLDAHVQVALRVIIELRNRLGRDGVVNVDLADADLTAVFGHFDIGGEAVDRARGVEAARVRLAQLGPAVLAVWGSNAASR